MTTLTETGKKTEREGLKLPTNDTWAGFCYVAKGGDIGKKGSKLLRKQSDTQAIVRGRFWGVY